MGERVSFPVEGSKGEGFLERPASGKGPAVVVIQEWWGLVPHVEDVVSRFAREGFLAMAPDLYHGRTTDAPDEAGRLLMELDVERAGREIAGAGAFLLSLPKCSSRSYGVVGFCMGGALAQYAATHDKKVGAAVSFYGGFKNVSVDWSKLSGPILLVYGGKDEGVPASQAEPTVAKIRALGGRAESAVYPEARHGFFNDSRPAQHDPAASKDAWAKTLALFRENLR